MDVNISTDNNTTTNATNNATDGANISVVNTVVATPSTDTNTVNTTVVTTQSTVVTTQSTSTSTNTQEFLDIKATLSSIFSNSPQKIAQIDNAITLVNQIISIDQINQFISIVKNLVSVEHENEPTPIKILDMLEPIKEILDQLYSDLVLIKADLSGVNRTFIQNNIDVIAQVIILMSCKELIDLGYINQNELTKILIFINALHITNIDMTIKKCFTCCNKNKN